MSYLKFDKSRMVNLEYSLEREILRTNRRGAYHCTTIVECNTRKQHGLLVMPVPAIDNLNHVMLSSFDETVIQHGAEFNLGIHKYDGDNYSPMGHKYIREFDCDMCPKTIYRVGGVILSKEKMFSLKDNSIMIRYTLLDAHSPTTIRFRPFLAFRNINSLTFENNSVNKEYTEVENGISTCMYEGYPDLYMQFSKKAKFIFDPLWNKGIEYKEDMQAGLPYKEDQYVPGYFELPIKKGETIIFSAGDRKVSPSTLIKSFEEGLKERTPRSSFYNCLKNSGHQFYFKPNEEELYLLEGYPWFKVNATAQFCGLPGLTLYIGKDEAFEKIMDTAIPFLHQFMEGKPVKGYIENIEKPDVLLWVTWALGKFARKYKEHCFNKYGNLILEIVDFFLQGKHPNVKILENGLFYSDGRGSVISWMDAKVYDKPLIARTGCLVELNALWYNAIMHALEITKRNGENSKLEKRLSELTQKVKTSFNETFVNGSGYLYDYVDGNYVNWSVRPNMLLAVSVEYSPLDRAISKSIFAIATKELLTPKGIRTLSPKSEGYIPYYAGSQSEKDHASFNGLARPGLLAAYADASFKIMQRAGIFHIELLIAELEEEMSNGCIGSLSQMYDANPPFSGHGAPSYALNVAGVLHLLNSLKEYEEEL